MRPLALESKREVTVLATLWKPAIGPCDVLTCQSEELHVDNIEPVEKLHFRRVLVAMGRNEASTTLGHYHHSQVKVSELTVTESLLAISFPRQTAHSEGRLPFSMYWTIDLVLDCQFGTTSMRISFIVHGGVE